MFDYKIERINEITKEVDNYLKFNSEKINNEYKINKEMFLNTLTDVTATRVRDYIEFDYNFLNKRINQKYYQMYNKLDDLTSKQDLFSEIVLRITEILEGRDCIYINYDNYFNDKDDISEILFLIDKDVSNSVYEYSGLNYNRKQEDEESEKYFAKYGRDLIWLDEDTMDSDGFLNCLNNTIGESDVITQASNQEDNYEAVERLLERAKLTKRQREVIEALMYCEFNQTHAAKELDISQPTVKVMLDNIKDRFDKNVYNKKEEKRDILKEFNTLIDNDDIAADDILRFASENIEDANINEMVYSLDDDMRKLFIQYHNKKNVFLFDKEKIAKRLLQYHYNR